MSINVTLMKINKIYNNNNIFMQCKLKKILCFLFILKD